METKTTTIPKEMKGESIMEMAQEADEVAQQYEELLAYFSCCH